MNVLLVNHYPEHQHEILPQVIEELKKLDGGHRYRLVYDLKPRFKHFLWTLGQPTRVVSMYQLRAFKPDWATIWTQRRMTKSQEYDVLGRAGISVPRWTALTRENKPDLTDFSDYVVVKPDWGCCGALVRIVSKKRIRWEKPVIEKAGRSISDDWIIQEYVHTGPWPVSYRVGTVFGEPVYSWRILASCEREPFGTAAKRDAQFFSGRTIVASSKGCVFDTDIPEDVLELARRVHSAFPTIPLLGTDVVRELDTGELFVIDINTNGNTFHLTSDTGKKIAQEFGIDMFSQFGGAKAVAQGIFGRLSQPTVTESLNRPAIEEVQEGNILEGVAR